MAVKRPETAKQLLKLLSMSHVGLLAFETWLQGSYKNTLYALIFHYQWESDTWLKVYGEYRQACIDVVAAQQTVKDMRSTNESAQ